MHKEQKKSSKCPFWVAKKLRTSNFDGHVVFIVHNNKIIMFFSDRKIDAIVIASNDSHFAPLGTFIRETQPNLNCYALVNQSTP